MNKKRCPFCDAKVKNIDYKNVPLVKRYLSFFARIKPRYYTGVCLNHQKMLAVAVKRARHLALVPFVR